MIDLLNDKIIELGGQGENLATPIPIDLTPAVTKYGQGSAVIIFQASPEHAPEIVIAEREGDVLTWTPTAAHLQVAGYGRCEIRWYVGDVIAKSYQKATHVVNTITGEGQKPEELPTWLDTLAELVSISTENASTAATAAATATQKASDAVQSADDAEDAKEEAISASTSARNSAVSAMTDADQAHASAESAAGSASRAEDSETAAKASEESAASNAGIVASAVATAEALKEQARVYSEYAQSSASSAENNAAIVKATKDQALDDIEAAKTSGIAAVNTAKAEGVQAVTAAKTEAVNAIGAAKTSGLNEINAAANVQRITNLETGQSSLSESIAEIQDELKELIIIPDNLDLIGWDQCSLGKRVLNDGNTYDSATYWRSNDIPVDEGSNYTLSLISNNATVYINAVTFYSGTPCNSSTYIRGSQIVNTNLVTVPIGAKYMNISMAYTNGATSDNISPDYYWQKVKLQKGTSGSTINPPSLSNKIVVGVSNFDKATAYKVKTGTEWYLNKKILAYGDSLTEQNKWQPHVSAYYETSAFWNGGIGGTTVANNGKTVRIWDGSTINGWMCGDDRINLLRRNYTPDMILIFAGHNDWSDSIPIGEIGTVLNDSTFKSAYVMMLKKLISIYPNKRIVCMTPINGRLSSAGTSQDIEVKNSIGLTMADYAKAVLDVCQRYGVPCINLSMESGIGVLNSAGYLSDVIHPNDNGGKMIASAVINGLKRYEPFDL